MAYDASDLALLERVNPIFNTAKMCLYQLAMIGDEDAAALSDKLGLTFGETQDSATTKASEEQVNVGLAMMEARYRVVSAMAKSTGAATFVDLPCGYTPRAISFARAGYRYVGLDLPATIAEAEPAIRSLMGASEQGLVKFAGVDATNLASLEAALAGAEGPLCITTEGLLMYFAESEVGAFMDNVRALLKRHGGCWITADPEAGVQYVLMLRALYGDEFMRVMSQASQQVQDKSDVKIATSRVTVRPGPDAAKSMRAAMELFAAHGLKAERVTVADYLPDLVVPTRMGVQETVRQAMEQCAYWKIALADEAPGVEGGQSARNGDVHTWEGPRGKGFSVDARLEGTRFDLDIAGRFDTLSAPEVLKLYEEVTEKSEVASVHVDCAALDYVSSAGLRVLMRMAKKSPEGVTLTGVNAHVFEIIEQTGFDEVLNVEKM